MKTILFSLLFATASFAEPSTADVSALEKSNPHFKPIPKKNGADEHRFQQGDEVLPKTAIAGYNTPAGGKLEGKNDHRIPDLSFDVSFIYYYIQQEGLNLANSGQVVNPSGGTNLVT